MMNDSLLLAVGPGFTRRVQKTTDHREEFKDIKGQYYDQDLKHYDKEVEQINYDELHSCHKTMACGLTQLESTVVLGVERETVC